MKAMELPVSRKGYWRNIAITLTTRFLVYPGHAVLELHAAALVDRNEFTANLQDFFTHLPKSGGYPSRFESP
jgi:hypothetical protein